MSPQIKRAIEWADFYRSLGWQPLPSRHDGRAPALDSYAEYWEKPFPARTFEMFATPNIQLMCGVKWNLVVVDLDGELGKQVYRNLVNREGSTPTWQVRSPSGGRHIYFLPPDGAKAVPSGRVWGLWDTLGGKRGDGGWVPHQGIEIIGDHHLVTAPPSIRKDGRYRWIKGCRPQEMERPAILPFWIDNLKRLNGSLTGGAQTHPKPSQPKELPPRSVLSKQGAHYDFDAVRASIRRSGATAIKGLAEEWGIEFVVDGSNSAGWMRCRAISKPGHPGRSSGDRNPSAAFNPETGQYKEFYPDWGPPISLFNLGVFAGKFSTPQECCNELGARFGADPNPKFTRQVRDLTGDGGVHQ
jgi:hypothetical protein